MFVRKVKKEIQDYCKPEKKSIIERLYARKKLFYRIANTISNFLNDFLTRREVKKLFVSVLQWVTKYREPEIFLSGSKHYQINDYWNMTATPAIIKIFENPAYQKKLRYKFTAMTPAEFVAWYPDAVIVKEDESQAEIDKLIDRFQVRAYSMLQNPKDTMFYIVEALD